MAEVGVLNLDVAHLLYLFCCFLHNARWKIDFKLIWNHYAFCLAIDQGLRQLLSICFVTSIMFTLYVQIKRSFTSIAPSTSFIRTRLVSFELFHFSSFMNLPTGFVSLSLELGYIPIVVILNSEDLHESIISFFRFYFYLFEQILVLDEQIVEFSIVWQRAIILGHFKGRTSRIRRLSICIFKVQRLFALDWIVFFCFQFLIIFFANIVLYVLHNLKEVILH